MKRHQDAAERLEIKRHRFPTRYCFATAAAAAASALAPETKPPNSRLPNAKLSPCHHGLPSGLLGESTSRIDPLSANLLHNVARGGSATGAGRTAIAAMKVSVFAIGLHLSIIVWPCHSNLAQLTFGAGRRRCSCAESHGKIWLFWPLRGQRRA